MMFALLVAAAALVQSNAYSAQKFTPNLITPGSKPVCTASGCGPSIASAPAIVVEREEVTRIVREKSCPSGMDLSSDGMCVGLDICPVAYTCPPNSAPRGDGRCVVTQRPTVECPPGHTLKGRTCVSTDMQPAELTCKDPRYTLDYASNVCVMTIETPARCPPGYQMEGEDCVQSCPTQPTCPAGWNLSASTRECVRTITEPATPVCPEGAMQEPGSERCIVVRQEPPRCPQRYVFDSTHQTCVQSTPRVPMDCPYGYTRVGRSCERTERTPAEMTCPAGYELGHDNVCVQEVPVPPTCPQGYVMSSTNQDVCEKCVKEQPVCPPGTKSVGYGNSLRCETEVDRPSKECCPSGFELYDGRCRRLEVTAPLLTCENQCFSVTETPVAYACPQDSEFVDDPKQPRCVRRLTSSVCEPARRCMEEVDGDGVMRSLKGGVCSPTPPVCQDLPNVESLPAEPYCPQGGTLEGRRCVMREPIVPERVCKTGTMDPVSGQCVREVFAPIKMECPAGTIKKGTRCVSIEVSAPDMVCPSGSEMGPTGVCLQTKPTITSPPRMNRMPAQPKCPPGTTLSGGECLECDKKPVEMTCPQGAIDTGKGCFVTAELITPPPVEKPVKPVYVCPSHATLVGGRNCQMTERVSADETCPQGTIRSYDGCRRVTAPLLTPPKVLTAPAVPKCPTDCSTRGTTCLRTMQTEAIVSCDDQFYLEGEHCVQEVEHMALCPEGTTLQGSGCVREVKVPPKIRIVNGCVNEVVRACENCPAAEVKARCHQEYF